MSDFVTHHDILAVTNSRTVSDGVGPAGSVSINLEGTVMKSSIWRAWLGAAAIGLAAVMPVRAEVVTFEDVTPTIIGGGASLTSGSFTFTGDGLGAFLSVDNAGALLGGPPSNPNGQFLSMFFNAGVIMSSTNGSAFFLNSFDAAFLAFAGESGVLGGELTAALTDTLGAVIQETFLLTIGQFSSFSLDASRGTALSTAYFFACAYQSDGSCSSNGDVSPQFALDNLSVPEPGAAFLALTALGMLFIRRRKATTA